MSSMIPLVLPLMYPMAGYYIIKYSTNAVVDVMVSKTKDMLWFVVTYPFKKSESNCDCKCNCKCNKNISLDNCIINNEEEEEYIEVNVSENKQSIE